MLQCVVGGIRRVLIRKILRTIASFIVDSVVICCIIVTGWWYVKMYLFRSVYGTKESVEKYEYGSLVNTLDITVLCFEYCQYFSDAEI